jgi:hypothetical protein
MHGACKNGFGFIGTVFRVSTLMQDGFSNFVFFSHRDCRDSLLALSFARADRIFRH